MSLISKREPKEIRVRMKIEIRTTNTREETEVKEVGSVHSVAERLAIRWVQAGIAEYVGEDEII